MLAVKQNTAIDSDCKRFVELVTKGIESWLEAGAVVATAIKKDESFVDRLCSQVPGLSPETVYRFELIGLGRALPEVFLSDSPGMKRLRRLPVELQQKYTRESVDLLVSDSSNGDTLKVDVRNLSASQAVQVFTKDGVRSISAQRAWLVEHTAAESVEPIEAALPYRVSGRKLIIKQACIFTAADLARILAEIEN